MVFKDTNLKLLFKTKNTIGNLLKHNSNNINNHKESDIYQLICPNCSKRYVGQSGISSYGLKNIFKHLNCVMINASSFSTLLQTDIQWAQLITLLICYIYEEKWTHEYVRENSYTFRSCSAWLSQTPLSVM